MSARIAALYRYPVKGLGAEALATVRLAAGGGFPGDRRHALALVATPDTACPAGWLPKSACLAAHRLPALAALDCRLDERGRLSIRRRGHELAGGNPADAAERTALERFFRDFAGAETNPAPSELRLATALESPFTDAPEPLVSIVARASLAELERRCGQPLDVRRFRANLVVEETLPWQELDWIGAELAGGDVRLRVVEPIMRCAAIHADPASGRAEGDLLRPLARLHGEPLFGVYARVTAGGTLAVGDALAAPAGGRLPDRSGLGLR